MFYRASGDTHPGIEHDIQKEYLNQVTEDLSCTIANLTIVYFMEVDVDTSINK